jgi:hypothetical protein
MDDLFYVAASEGRRNPDAAAMQAGIRRLRILRRRGVPPPPGMDTPHLFRPIRSHPDQLAALGRLPTNDPELASPSAAEITSMAEIVEGDRDSRAVYARGEKAQRVRVLRQLAATVATAEQANGGLRTDNALAGVPERLAEARRRNDAKLARLRGA